VAIISKELGVIQAFAAAGVKARSNIATITTLLVAPNYTKGLKVTTVGRA
jgi:hypothetical protein